MKIRKATKQDITGISKVNKSLELDLWEASRYLQSERWIGNNLEDYFVYEESKSVLGAIHFKSDYGEIVQLAVQKGFQRKGIGSELIFFTKEKLIEEGAISMGGYSAKMYNAEDFYRNLGFKIIDEGENWRFKMNLQQSPIKRDDVVSDLMPKYFPEFEQS